MVLNVRWHGAVAQVELERPERINALNAELITALVETGRALAHDSACRAVVLSGAGRGFCSGIDLDALRSASSGQECSLDTKTDVSGGANIAQRAVLEWRDLPVPVIAAIHGVAFGGGLQLALGADLRIVRPDAQLALMEVKWGLIPDMCGMALLPQLIRRDVLAELVFTGRVINGEEAVRIGVATRTAEDPISAALDLAATIARLSPDAVRAAKRLMRREGELAETLRAEAREQAFLFGRPNQQEAVAAELAKRAPVFWAWEAPK